MSEREWVEKIKKECVLNVGNFDTRYAIQLVGRSGSKIGIVSLNKQFMSVDIIDKQKYERFYDQFYSRRNKESRPPLVIDYHIEHSIGRGGFKELWDFYYKKVKSRVK
jgi:hypothetical protein